MKQKHWSQEENIQVQDSAYCLIWLHDQTPTPKQEKLYI